MRDPAGRIRFVSGKAVRVLNDAFSPPAFLDTASARALVDDGRIVPYTVQGNRMEAPAVPFVSLPTEWCDAQLYDAARLTLDVAACALAEGHELKDASAWNIIFDGCAPLFCDHLSFQPVASRQWWAFGQYCRHFLFPLLCASRGRLHGQEFFLLDRDGITAQRARALLGPGGLFSKAAPALLAREGGAAASVAAPQGKAGELHDAVLRYCRAATPAPARPRSHWSRYMAERDHYAQESAVFKRRQVENWINAHHPAWVLDSGCNTGEFARLALSAGACTIALDLDHDSVQALYAGAAHERRLYPVIANLADLRGGRGWAAAEFPSLLERLEGRADMLLMLAVVHHLHFSESIPLEEIAALCARLTRDLMILEVVDADDPLSRRLAAQRARDTSSFSASLQMAAFGLHFDILERAAIPGTARELVLFRKRP